MFTWEEMQPQDIEQSMQARDPGLGEYLSQQLEQGYMDTPLGPLGIEKRVVMEEARRTFAEGEQMRTPMTREAWQASPHYREGVEFRDDMTPVRAQIYAEEFDDMQYRKDIIRRGDNSAFRSALGFGAALVGSLPDPINLIPFAGWIKGAGLAKNLGMAALEGGVGNLSTSLLTRPYYERFGQDIEWQDYAIDTAVGAALGPAFAGAGAGARAVSERARLDLNNKTKQAVARGVEARIAGEEPANVEGLLDATNEVRAKEGLEQVDFSRRNPVETIRDPEPVDELSFVTEEDLVYVDELEARGELTEADQEELLTAREEEAASDSVEEAYIRAVECV